MVMKFKPLKLKLIVWICVYHSSHEEERHKFILCAILIWENLNSHASNQNTICECQNFFPCTSWT